MSKAPCKQCGEDNRYANGACKTCKLNGIAAIYDVQLPCVKCGARDRRPSGGCRPCSAKTSKKWQQNNETRIREWRQQHANEIKKSNERSRLRRLYGVTPDQVEAMVASQDSRCAICKKHCDFGRGQLVIDHCHSTGMVRSLLCVQCNAGLGNFYESRESLLAAVEYLRLHTEGAAL